MHTDAAGLLGARGPGLEPARHEAVAVPALVTLHLGEAPRAGHELLARLSAHNVALADDRVPVVLTLLCGQKPPPCSGHSHGEWQCPHIIRAARCKVK
jgi:hypothetical protein